MYSAFQYQTLPLQSIMLDARNPRIVTQSPLKSEVEILNYLFVYEDLLGFVKKIANEGRNLGAERPYVVREGATYTVIEGNTRIAAYKVLTGLLKPTSEFLLQIPNISSSESKALQLVDCSIAPSRDALLPIMANAHFGQGDKNKWGYLGSRKAVYDEWKLKNDIPLLARTFDRTETQIRELILEYLLYQEALGFSWTPQEREVLLRPSVEFNPPVRFLETKGHKELVGIQYISAGPSINFQTTDAKDKLRHLVLKLVVAKAKGLSATSSYKDVFADYKPLQLVGVPTLSSQSAGKVQPSAPSPSSGASGTGTGGPTGAPTSSNSSALTAPNPQPAKMAPGSLFPYEVTVTNALLSQLMREARSLNVNKFPAAGTFLLRNIMEALLKHIIDQQKANPASTSLDLEASINLCKSKNVALSPDDRKVLSEFQKNYLNYINLGAHANVIPNPTMVLSARDCVDQFIKKNI